MDKQRFKLVSESKKKLIKAVSSIAVSVITAFSFMTVCKTPLLSVEKNDNAITILSDSFELNLPNYNKDDEDEEDSIVNLLKRERTEQSKKIQILKRELTSTKERLEQLKTDLMVRGYSTEKVLKQKVESLEIALDKTQKEVNALSIELKSKQDALESKRKELENATTVFLDNLKRQSEALENQENAFKSEQAKARTLSHELSSLKAMLEEKDEILNKTLNYEQDVRDAAQKISALEDTLRNTHETLLSEREEKESLRKAWEQEKEARAEFLHEIASLKERLHEENDYAENLTDLLENLTAEQNAENFTLASTLFDLTVRLYQGEQLVDSLKAKLEQQEIALNDTQQKNTDLDDHKTFFERQFEMTQGEKNELFDKLNQANDLIIEAEQKFADLQEQKNKLESDLEISESKQQELSSKLEQASLSLNEAEERLTWLQDQKNTFENDLEVSEENKRNLASRFDQIDQSLHEAEQKISDLENQRAHLMTELDTSENSRQNLNEHLDQTLLALNEARQKISDLEDHQANLERQLDISEDAKHKLTAQLDQAEENIAHLYAYVAQIDQKLESQSQSATAQEADFLEKLSVLSEKLREEYRERDSMKREFETAQHESELKMIALNRQIEEEESKAQTFSKLLDNALAEKEESLKQTQLKAFGLAELLQEALNEKEELIAEAETVKRYADGLQEDFSSASGQREELENTIRNLRTEQQTLEEQIKDLRENLENEQQKNRSLNEEIENIKFNNAQDRDVSDLGPRTRSNWRR